ncbi:hypothetical protein E2P81_ATG07212 [Venturia nashicola]|uniref:Uncharacterized protein n=1 Tax=Venturia nashicola TaxID=86259 RepID=A0A4Z1P6C2_9PEZI|nr:hypothetical protein E6O75_ATG07375 [Venturia nashicola]TLD31722.1 hypothetical protein E2P81_ATG07212 [Venturia nashicola]
MHYLYLLAVLSLPAASAFPTLIKRDFPSNAIVLLQREALTADPLDLGTVVHEVEAGVPAIVKETGLAVDNAGGTVAAATGQIIGSVSGARLIAV